MKTSEEIIKIMENLAPQAIRLPKEFDKCIVGILDALEGFVFLYSESKILVVLETELNMKHSKAVQHLEVKILGASNFPKAPAFLFDTL